MADNINTRAWKDYRSHWKQSLGFHFIMQALGVALFGPLATLVARRLVSAAGEPVISNYELVGFVLSPIGVLFVLLAVSLSIGLLLAEFAGQSWISGHAIARKPTTVRATVAVVLRRLQLLLRLGTRIFLRLLLLALPFLAIAALLWFTTLGEHDINYYLTERPPQWRRAMVVFAVLGLAYGLLAAWQLARWIYAVPILVFEPQWPQGAINASVKLSRGRAWALFVRLLWWWVPLILLGAAAAWLGRELSDAALGWAGIEFGRVLPLVMLFVCVAAAFSFIHSGVLLGGHQFIVTRSCAEARDEARWRDAPPQEAAADPRHLAVPAIILAIVLPVIAMVGGAIIASRAVGDTPVAITAHRGASIDKPENSMAAFQAAVDGGADYIELDVQRGIDGTVMVVHDGDLMRMAADPRKVSEMSAADMSAIDIGRNYDVAFTGQTVPTLQQVIDLARGKLKINVELKYNVPDEGLAPAVVELLRRNEFVDQVVITSLEAPALKQIKSLEPRLKAGLIVTAAAGDVAKTDADFVSLNAARATLMLVRRAHRSGKEVHVWTVNTPEAMLRMIERGVDNIITDDPALLSRLIRRRAELSHGELLALRLRILFDRPPREVEDPEAVKVL